mgnify:CR=1 FL=1|jgi:hypothetical protein
MKKYKKTVKALQDVIDKFRSQGVHIDVSHVGNYDGHPETQIHIKFSAKYDAIEVGNDLRQITGPCDSGAGFGFRVLQLCSYWKGLK